MWPPWLVLGTDGLLESMCASAEVRHESGLPRTYRRGACQVVGPVEGCAYAEQRRDLGVRVSQ